MDTILLKSRILNYLILFKLALTFAGVAGKSVIQTPQASWIALMIAGYLVMRHMINFRV